MSECVNAFCVALVGPTFVFPISSPRAAKRASANNMAEALVHALDQKLQQHFIDFAHALGKSDSEFAQFAQAVFGASEDQAQFAQRFFAASKALGRWELGLQVGGGDSLPTIQAEPAAASSSQLPPIHVLDSMALAAEEALQVQEYELALALALGLAQDAVTHAEAMLPQGLNEARDLLTKGKANLTEGKVTSLECAKAYKKVINARKLVREARPSCEQWTKAAALAVREVLVMQCSFEATDNSKNAFEEVLHDAFEKKLNSTDELKSQMHLSRHHMCELGGDRETFSKRASGIFGRKLSDEEKACLFVAYRAMNAHSWKSTRARVRKRAKSSSINNSISPVHVPATMDMHLMDVPASEPLNVSLPS